MDANDLGSLKGGEMVESRFGRVIVSDDIWDPDADASSTTSEINNGENIKNTREWNLIVVNDEKMVNAMATYGKPINSSIFLLLWPDLPLT